MEKISIILVCLVATTTIIHEAQAAKDVSNEEIRDAILSLVHSYNLLDNKLERHEHRERGLGELLKKGIIALQKGQKAFEPMNDIYGRLDDRVNQIETMLIVQEDKYNLQAEKLGEAFEGIFKWMRENNECFNKRVDLTEKLATTAKLTPPPPPPINKELTDKIHKITNNVQDLMKITSNLSNKTEKLIQKKIPTTDEIIAKLDDKMSKYLMTESPPTTTTTESPNQLSKNHKFEEKISKYLDEITENLKNLQVNGLTSDDRSYIQGLSNQTINSIEDLKLDILTASDKALTKTTLRLKETNEQIDQSLNDITKLITESNETAEKFYNDVNSSYITLNEGLDVFNKFDKILLGTSDYILDTQRKVEFGTHQIIQKVNELIHEENSLLNKTIQKRFNDIDNSIINNHLEALQNLSSTMEYEISHVWRQIEIMHSEITYSKNALNKLQGQTEAYVNGTFVTMDSMEGKVSQITGRMAEVDLNLNFLLGRLSLVTQEFNRIKTGLGLALDEIRNSFQDVQDKIKTVGPGPHNIPKNKYETDINLLQRDAPAQP